MHHHHDRQEGANTPAPPCLDLDRLAPLGTAGAAPAGLSNPTNDDVPGDQAEGIKGQAGTDKGDSVAASANQQAIADRKRFSTLRARLALAGYALSRIDASDGAVIYRASRWGMTRALDNLVDVESFAARVGVAR